MMKLLLPLICLSLLLSAGCKARPRAPVGDTPVPPALDAPPEIFDARTWTRQHEKGEKISKTVEWLDVGTREGTTYNLRTVKVDKIIRFDAEDLYGVNLRLKNTTTEEIVCEARIDFFDIRGDRRIGFRDGWRSILIKPLDFAHIENSCKIKGAVGFNLYLRPRGTEGDGTADFTAPTEDLPLAPSPAPPK